MQKIFAITLLLIPVQTLGIQTEKVFTYTQHQKNISTEKNIKPTYPELSHGIVDLVKDLAFFVQPAVVKALWSDLTKKRS